VRRLLPGFCLTVLLVHLNGCNEPVELFGTYEEKVVVYAILTSLSDTQYVRLYRTYNPEGNDPLGMSTDNPITGALVTIRDGATVYRFHDTTIVRADKSRYQTDIKAYVAYSLAVEGGKTYTLEIQLPGTTAIQVETTVPRVATMRNDNFFALQHPFVFNDDIDLKCFLSPLTRGYVVHAYVEYEALVNAVWTLQREEIPLAVRSQTDCTTFDAVYPPLLRRKEGQPELTLYSISAYTSTLRKIWSSYPPLSVRLIQVAFELHQLDKHLYDYYNIVNGFRDQFSIRSDEPDYSNIPGGVGVFGALTKQRLVVSIPDTLGRSLRCP
jgi:hypothetical protein